jgi:hypothetical protein
MKGWCSRTSTRETNTISKPCDVSEAMGLNAWTLRVFGLHKPLHNKQKQLRILHGSLEKRLQWISVGPCAKENRERTVMVS